MQVYLYDLAVNKTTPVNRLEMPNRRPVASLAFGPQGDVLAAGDWVGSVRVTLPRTNCAVSCYARARPCPVLRYAVCRRTCPRSVRDKRLV